MDNPQFGKIETRSIKVDVDVSSGKFEIEHLRPKEFALKQLIASNVPPDLWADIIDKVGSRRKITFHTE